MKDIKRCFNSTSNGILVRHLLAPVHPASAQPSGTPLMIHPTGPSNSTWEFKCRPNWIGSGPC